MNIILKTLLFGLLFLGSLHSISHAGYLSKNGYQQFSNGFMMQWGYVPYGNEYVKFPVEFTEAYSISITPVVEGYSRTSYAWVVDLSNDSFTLNYEGTGSERHPDGWYWQAVGMTRIKKTITPIPKNTAGTKR